MNMNRHVPALIVLLMVVGLATGASVAASPDVPELDRVKGEFKTFLAGLKPADLSAGSCVGNATAFYARLQEAGITTTPTRIVLLVREPNRGMPNPMVPNPEFLRGERVKFWIWHAFVHHGGIVFDPNYLGSDHTLATYMKNFWGKDPNRDSFWVFSVQMKEFPSIAGSDYPGAPPRMLRFRPLSIAEYLKRPDHISQRK